MDRIFVPFFRGEPGDTGIGLSSTVEKIVKVYGGSITAYNDVGACFEFRIMDYRARALPKNDCAPCSAGSGKDRSAAFQAAKVNPHFPCETGREASLYCLNLGNFMRRFALSKTVSHWSLRSVQLKLIKIGASVISHSRRTVFQCAGVAVPAALFADLLDRIHRLAAVPT